MVDIRLIINQFVASVLPSQCILCHSPLENNDNGAICQHCWSTLPWLGPHCQLCALPMPDSDELLCGHCQLQPPPWQQAHALFQYREPIRKLIHQCKYQHHFFTGNMLGKTWSRALEHQPVLENVDAVIPVPLHWRRQWHRGYNQVVELFRPVAKTLALTVETGALKRVRHTQYQAGKDRKSRLQNLQHAFVCRDNKINNKNLLLVDDVMTTGATLQSATNCLLQAGARNVRILVLARAAKS